jgi:hypothetical protein
VNALAEAIRQVIVDRAGNELFQKRRSVNVQNPSQTFVLEDFWKQMVGCLCSSVQRVDPDSPLVRFERLKPYPLSLSTCKEQNDVESYAHQQISGAGMRFGPTIAARLVKNLHWLDQGGWFEVERQFVSLAGIARSAPADDCIKVEREAAHLAMKMDGIGPKQSRNLWICLGLTRYEIPLDSRVAKWFNVRQASFIEAKKLGSSSYYEATEDRIQSLCNEAGVLPCEFDAAAFISEEKPGG